MVLDTNFLVAPYKLKVDAFSQIADLVDGKAEFVVLSSCLNEVASLPVKERIAANSSVEFLKKKGLAVEKDGGGKPDEKILEYAQRNLGGCVVCTNDVVLRRKLRAMGVKTIFVRQKMLLKMD